MEELYRDFLQMVPKNSKSIVDELDAFLLDNDGKRSIEPSAKGYLLRCSLSEKVLLNYVVRKGCVKARIYAAHVGK